MNTTVATAENLNSVDLKASLMEAVEKQNEGAQYDVHTEIANINKMYADDEVEGNMRAAVRIARMVGLVREIAKSLEAETAFDEARKQRQVYPEQPGANPHYPLVRVCEGNWDQLAKKTEFEGLKELTVWRPNVSSLKYAQVIRAVLALGWPTDEVAKRIREYVNPDTKRVGINGLIEADRKANPSPKRQRGETWKKGEREAARKFASLGSVTTSDTSFEWTDGEFTLAVVRKNKDGTADVIGHAGINGTPVVKAVQALVQGKKD